MKKYLTIISLVLLTGSAQASASEGSGLTYDPYYDYYALDSDTQEGPAEGLSTQVTWQSQQAEPTEELSTRVTEQSQLATGMQWPEGL